MWDNLEMLVKIDELHKSFSHSTGAGLGRSDLDKSSNEMCGMLG